MKKLCLIILLLTGLAWAQPSSSVARRIQGGTKPATCTAGPPADVWVDTTVSPPVLNVCGPANTWNAGSGGITNSAGNNVIPKSNSTNLIASSLSDTGSLVSTAENVSLINPTAAVHLTPQNSPIFSLCGAYFNGSASAQDCWSAQVVMGTADNGTSTLTFSHVGSSGGGNATAFPGPIQSGTGGGVGGTLDLPEGTTAIAATGHDLCYADSTLHNIKCSANNGAFYPAPLGIAASTAGDILYFDGTAWQRFAGNTSGSKVLTESSAGVLSWGTGVTPITAYVAPIRGASNLTAQTSISHTWCAGWYLPAAVTASHIAFVTAVGDASNNSDFGIYDVSGNLVAHTGAIIISGAATQIKSLVGAPVTLAAGKIYVCQTSLGTTLQVSGDSGINSFFNWADLSITTSGGALNASITPPADNPANTNGGVPRFNIY